MPGVESAAAMDVLPVSCNCDTDWVRFVGRPYNGIHNEVNDREVSTGFSTTLAGQAEERTVFQRCRTMRKPKVVHGQRGLRAEVLSGRESDWEEDGRHGADAESIREIVGVVERLQGSGIGSGTMACRV
jgi:macrolide transport system ATP-binding/permease protein